MLRLNIFGQFLSAFRMPVPSTLGLDFDEFDHDSGGDLKSLSPALNNAVASKANPAFRTQVGRDRDESSRNLVMQYRAVALHEKHARPIRLTGSDALIITRFVLADGDKALLEILGREEGGVRILNARFGGMEVHWNNDLMQAYERRTAIYSRMLIRSDDGDVELEHLVVPGMPCECAPVIRGWFNTRQGATLTPSLIQGNTGILRTHRGSPVTLPVLAGRVSADS